MFGDSVQNRVTGSVGAYLTCYAYASPYAHVHLASLLALPPRYSTHHEQLDRTLLEEQRRGGNQKGEGGVRGGRWHGCYVGITSWIRYRGWPAQVHNPCSSRRA